MTFPTTQIDRRHARSGRTVRHMVMMTLLSPLAVLAGTLPEPTIPGPLGVQLKAHNANTATLDEVQKLGLKYVRRGFIWANVEKSPGVYDFSEYDQLVKECRDRNLKILGCIALGNDKVHGPVREEKGRQAYARYAAALAERYKDEDIIWELWNEPNIQTFWGKHGKHNSEQYAQEYTALVRETVPAMKKADPNCFVMAGSVSGLWSASFEWQQACFDNGILKTGIDGWSIHPYTSKMPEDYFESYARVRRMMAEQGVPAEFPMLNTERGFPLGKAEGFSGGDESKIREYQAWHLVRQYLVDQLADVKLTIWYEWSGNEGFSLFDKSEQLPIYFAAKVLIEQLNGYRLDERLSLASDRDFVLRFTKDGAPAKLVVWTAPPPDQIPEMAIPHEVEIPVGLSGWVAATDTYGNTAGIEAKSNSLRVTLTGAPQYITLNALAAKPEPVKGYRSPIAKQQAEQQAPKTQADLKLFEPGVDWTFAKNTGEGSFELSSDASLPIGVLHYDFTNSSSRSTPYVLASVDTDIPESAQFLQVNARSPRKQPVTFRVVDSTGQTHQFKGSVQGTQSWETIVIPLNRKLEHWGGANDGKIHFPIKSFVISVPQPSGEPKTGKIEFSGAAALSR